MDRKILKAIIMDVDGTLTDGGIYLDSNGGEMKKFHVKDGYAIHDLLPELGILPIILTGRTSKMVAVRAEELGIRQVFQGSKNKVEDMLNILTKLQIDLSETAYMGDDINDLACMKLAGVRGCPGDAADEVKRIAHYISVNPGGSGAVRDFIEWIKAGKWI